MLDGKHGGKSEGVRAMSKRGSGGIYLRGTTWWVRYYLHGHEFRESAETDSETVARKFLTKRIRESGRRGKFVGPSEDRLTFGNLAEAIESDYTVNGLRSLRRLRGSLKHLRQYFGLDRAVDITADRIRSYARQRCETGKAASATVNRELAALKRAFTILVEDERLSRAPKITMLDEHNARQGFLEHADWIALRQALPDWLRDPIAFLYLSGWRVGEMKSLKWSDVDLEEGEIRLRSEISKTEEAPRVLPLAGELANLFARADKERRLDCPYVFHRAGKPIRDFRHAWTTACTAAGLTGRLVHDLRRTAIRNLVRAGVSDNVAMALSGHRTRSIFDRYNITSKADLKRAIEQQGEYLATRPTKRKIAKIK
jgi:integrase